MQLVTNYDLAPGQCRLCNSARLPAIDTGLDYDAQGFDGRLYICAVCAAALYSMTAGVLGAPGLVPAHRFHELTERNALLEQQVADLHTALEAGRGEGGLAETLRTLAGALERGQTSRPADQVTSGGAASASTEPTNVRASLPPHPTEEQEREVNEREERFGQAGGDPDPDLVQAHLEADRAQRGDQRTDPAGDFGTATVPADTPVPDDEEQARLRNDPSARFEMQQKRSDEANAKVDQAGSERAEVERERQSDQTGPTHVQSPGDAQAREDAAREGGDRFAQTHPGAEAAQASADWNERERIIAGQDQQTNIPPANVDNARTKAGGSTAQNALPQEDDEDAVTPEAAKPRDGRLERDKPGAKDETIDVGKPQGEAVHAKHDDKDHDPKGKPLGRDKDKAKK